MKYYIYKFHPDGYERLYRKSDSFGWESWNSNYGWYFAPWAPNKLKIREIGETEAKRWMFIESL